MTFINRGLSLPLCAIAMLFPAPPILALAAQQRPVARNAVAAPPDVAAPPADAQKTASGLASKVLVHGTGSVHPALTDTVTVNYTGWTTDGKMFDSTSTGNQPVKFALNRVIKGWGEGVTLMVVGEKRRFWIPAELAYAGRPDKPQGMLVFDIELVGITTAPAVAPAREAPPVPLDVIAPPPDANRTPSGLASKVLKPGTGKTHPTRTSRVTVHYTGWTTDGVRFDSSVVSGNPITFGLDQVIPGWTEGVQLMVEGETRRLWIPERLAYGGQAGKPKGMLVFDVELIAIK